MKANKYKCRETWHQQNAFETYLLLGQGRTLAETTKQINVGLSTLTRWKKQFNWDERIRERELSATNVVRKYQNEVFLNELKRQHIEYYDKVQQRAATFIDDKKSKFRDLKDAAVALDIGIKGQREVLGLRDNKLKAGIMKDGFAALMELSFGDNKESNREI